MEDIDSIHTIIRFLGPDISSWRRRFIHGTKHTSHEENLAAGGAHDYHDLN